MITRTPNGTLNNDPDLSNTGAAPDGKIGVLTAPSIDLTYIGGAVGNSGIEYSLPTVIRNLTLGEAGVGGSTVTLVTPRTIDNLVAINGIQAANSTLTFAVNTTLTKNQTIELYGNVVINAPWVLSIPSTGLTTFNGTVNGNVTITGSLVINNAYLGGTIQASENVKVGANGALAGTTNLMFVGGRNVTLTVPAGTTVINALTINKTSALNRVGLIGGNIQVGIPTTTVAPLTGNTILGANTGILTLIQGNFDTQDNVLIIPQPGYGNGQGFAGASDVSHVIGNVRKITKDFGTGLQNGASEPRIEFPLGTSSVDANSYKPLAITFEAAFGSPTVPNNQFQVAYHEEAIKGAVGLPIKDGVETGVNVARYPNFYWEVMTQTDINDKAFDLELNPNGFTEYEVFSKIRIIRRNGGANDQNNPWLLQGTNTSYDNAENTYTVIQRGANAGLRAGGAIFTLGLKSNIVAGSIADQQLKVGDEQDVSLSGVFTGKNIGTLAFSATSSNETIVTVESKDDSTLTIKGIEVGAAVITVTAKDAAHNDFISTSFDVNVSPVTDVVAEEIPTEFALYQNFPNPFNPTTNIKFDLPKESSVTVKVYNVLGEEVATLINRVMPAGKQNVEFNASKLASGMYIYRIQAGDFVQVRKMMLMK